MKIARINSRKALKLIAQGWQAVIIDTYNKVITFKEPNERPTQTKQD